MTRGNRSYCYCPGRAKLERGADKGPAQKFQADLLEQTVGPDPGIAPAQAMKALQQKLESVLSSQASRDRSLILDAPGISVIAHGDGSWDLELEAPREVAPTAQDVQLDNTEPRLG